MKLWETRPMPARERLWLTRITATVWAGVLAWNVSHVQEHLAQHLIHGWRMWALSFAPDILILIGVWKLRYRASDVVGWLMATVGVAWLSWAALSTTEATASGRLFAMAPIGTVVLMTLALEFEPSHASKPSPASTPARPARTRPTTPESRRVSAPSTTAAPPVPVQTVVDEKPAKLPTPTRERAREILLGLDDLESVSAGQLSRTYGGSDVWWGQRKAALRAELADMGSELPAR